mmetsp:Transcript_11416/g.19148  ORF Transcript_11416/g.19148 Transcript_11416/m.19148 type:complete len:311 (-) Transcript_11416:101-1033(-)
MLVESFGQITCEMSDPTLKELGICLLDYKTQHISKRTHAAFLLRTNGSPEAATIIAEALQIRDDSELMRHELAYVLGQMQHSLVCNVLERILCDETEQLIVRHECAEALGAIGCAESLPTLVNYCNHSAAEISETCKIAVDLLHWKASQDSSDADARGEGVKFLSVDPAPSVKSLEMETITTLKQKLMDTNDSLFNRYQAMFALRNINSDESAMALVGGLLEETESALFRHEIAYVLGQMQRNVTSGALIKVLRNVDEHAMVRHEAAEALGSIGGDEVMSVLVEFQNDKEQVVRESCEVAVNILDTWAPN